MDEEPAPVLGGGGYKVVVRIGDSVAGRPVAYLEDDAVIAGAIFQTEAAASNPGLANVATTAIFGRRLMENSVKELFERYEELFRMGLTNEVDMDRVASSYAAAFVAASPAGVSVGQNDEH